MSHPKGAVPLGTLGTIGRELKSWGVLPKLQYWITRLERVGAVRSQQEDFGVQGALAAGRNSRPKPPGGTGSGKPLEGGSFAFWASTCLALKAEGRTPLVLPEGNQKL